MYKIKEYMHKIIENNKTEDMEKIEEYFYKLMCNAERNSADMAIWIKEEMKELAYGKVISEEEAKHWVMNMKPYGQHWTIEQTTDAMKSLGYNCDVIHFFIVSNMMYNDYYNIVKEDENLALKMAHDWLNDEDAKENKLYCYYKHIVKH